MYREYDKTLDTNGAIRAVHVTIKELLRQASDLLKQERYWELAAVYGEISMLSSSLAETAEVREQRKQDQEQMQQQIAENAKWIYQEWISAKEVK